MLNELPRTFAIKRGMRHHRDGAGQRGEYLAFVARTPLRLLIVAATVLAMALLATACQQRGVNDALERSSAPILVPSGEWQEAFEFTAPPGATDLYQLRWNFAPGATDVVTGWQIASTTNYDQAAFAEGPGESLVDEALRASRGEDCQVADAAMELQLCMYPAEFARGGVNAYLVRLIQNHILVIDYNNIDGDRTLYDPDALEARFIAAEFDAVPIDGDISDYLVYIS